MKVKICGITNVEDALLAAQQGAWAVGFVFEPKSARYISPIQAGKISEALPKNIHKVGVFVNETALNVNRMAMAAGLTMVQLHGEETPKDAQGIALPIIKAIRLRNSHEIEALERWRKAEYVLIDSYVEGQRGGTGHVADWQLAKQASQGQNIILAGGISSKNVAEALQIVQPVGVDLSSGVEAETGRKSTVKMEEFFKKINALELKKENK